ncbi:TlpA family protein disulfide reductase [Nocardioides gansuensis]|uniref:TlpA family protein disulfide reductase n=1 Tax=Nocardioides gansuensis TaxID=2138300 RepID=UPI001FE469FF|nr:TlpA disulfide reductase family protein [Nocardioides gansuensis]
MEERGEPVSISGETLDGEQLSLDELRGKVVVVNVWWSACPPCRAEQPELNEVAEEVAGSAEFVGLNIRDLSPDAPQAYARSFEVPYPSIYDPDSRHLLALGLTARTIPATLVLDAEGRITATVRGRVPSKGTLADLIEDAAADA